MRTKKTKQSTTPCVVGFSVPSEQARRPSSRRGWNGDGGGKLGFRDGGFDGMWEVAEDEVEGCGENVDGEGDAAGVAFIVVGRVSPFSSQDEREAPGIGFAVVEMYQ